MRAAAVARRLAEVRRGMTEDEAEARPHALVDAPNPANVRMGGYQMLLAGDVLRGKFRESLSAPTPMVPGQVTRIEVGLGDRCHTFLKGHRVMVQIQSSWFPMFARNPQRSVDIYHAKPSDYQKATQRVYRTAALPSHLTLTVPLAAR